MNRQRASPAAIEHRVVTILLKGQLISGRVREQPLKGMDTVKDRQEKKKRGQLRNNNNNDDEKRSGVNAVISAVK